MDKKTGKAAPSSFGLKSDDRAENRKEVYVGPLAFCLFHIAMESFDNILDYLKMWVILH